MPRLTIQQRRDRDAAREAEKKAFGLDGDQEENNRVREFLSELNNQTNDPEEMMLEIMDALTATVTPVPDVGNFYTFVYNAKTPGESYDQHPLIACMALFPWGFRGLNFHWQKYRNYTWGELAGQLYIVRPNELDDLLAIPYAKFILNPR